MFKIADAVIQNSKMRHGPAREIYRQAVKTENNRRKYWKEQNELRRRNHDSGTNATGANSSLGVVLD